MPDSTEPPTIITEATTAQLLEEVSRRCKSLVCAWNQNPRKVEANQESIVTCYWGDFATCMGLWQCGIMRMKDNFSSEHSTKLNPFTGGEKE